MPKSIHGDEPPVIAVPKLNLGEDTPQSVPHTDTPPRARRKRSAPRVQSRADPVCPNGHAVTSAMKFCPQCGLEIPDSSKPPRCRNGHEAGLADRFCSMCGVSMAPEPTIRQAMTLMEDVRPRPDSELNEAERADRQRQHAAALRMGQQNPDPVLYSGNPPGKESVIIHVLVDGFGAFGQVWMRGQEMELWPGHPRWREAQDWIGLDVPGQYARWGRQMFGYGLWPGIGTYTAGAGMFQPLKQLSGEGEIAQPTEEELARADEAERRRARRVPMPLG